MKTSSGNRKHGRAGRKPSHLRYVNEGKRNKNKRRKVQKQANKTGKIVKYKLNNEWKTISPNN